MSIELVSFEFRWNKRNPCTWFFAGVSKSKQNMNRMHWCLKRIHPKNTLTNTCLKTMHVSTNSNVYKVSRQQAAICVRDVRKPFLQPPFGTKRTHKVGGHIANPTVDSYVKEYQP